MTVLVVLDVGIFLELGCETYNTKGANKDVGGVGLGIDHLSNEVCSHSYDRDEGNSLETAGNGVGRAEGAVLRSGHDAGFGERVAREVGVDAEAFG